jgi:hypothetical protein
MCVYLLINLHMLASLSANWRIPPFRRGCLHLQGRSREPTNQGRNLHDEQFNVTCWVKPFLHIKRTAGISKPCLKTITGSGLMLTGLVILTESLDVFILSKNCFWQREEGAMWQSVLQAGRELNPESLWLHSLMASVIVGWSFQLKVYVKGSGACPFLGHSVVSLKVETMMLYTKRKIIIVRHVLPCCVTVTT